MIQVEEIQIKYFRSIYNLQLKDLKDLTVFAGKNDIGKSNVLKALNLFFNNETDWHTPLKFEEDFCQKRLGEVRKSIKGKQFIEVAIKFKRGKRYEASLPENFTVTRQWYRDSATPKEKDTLSRQWKVPKVVPAQSLARAQANLVRYLKTLRYEYVPAVKDRTFFQ